jgi:hypothetical protein
MKGHLALRLSKEPNGNTKGHLLALVFSKKSNGNT